MANISASRTEARINPLLSQGQSRPPSQSGRNDREGANAKQKRKKPTLNCSECVNRKQKCGRERPTCLQCIRRQTTCEYTQIANILVATDPQRAGNLRNQTTTFTNRHASPVRLLNIADTTTSGQRCLSPDIASILQRDANSASGPAIPQGVTSRFRPGPFAVLEMGARHPFHNYWTGTGGLAEVVGVLPEKQHADALVEKYFETVDPIYPIIWRPDFQLEYDRFWGLSMDEKLSYDAGKLALQFVVYAAGTQFTESIPAEERVNTAEFYLSASHQALCIYSYLNCYSIPSIQTMVLIVHFTVSNNHVSDAWTLSGITQRQAYGLELNLDPDVATPELPFKDKQQRCKLWLATMFQDTSLSLYLKLPPTTKYYDLDSSCLRMAGNDQEYDSDNASGLGNILRACLPPDMSSPNDIAFLRSIWDFSAFVQTYVCVPRSLKRSISTDPAHKQRLIAQFRSIYNSFPSPFNSYDPLRFEMDNARLLRQLVAVASNYFYVLTILYMDTDAATGVEMDVYGALDASHEAMAAFFALARMNPLQLDMWGAYHTRGFAQAMMIGTVLAAQQRPVSPDLRDPRFMLAKSDLDRYADILIRARGTLEFDSIQKQRVADLKAVRNRITCA